VDAGSVPICDTIANKEGNGPLIAAAPEMLAELERQEKDLDEMHRALEPHDVLSELAAEMLGRVRAMIAKAKGET
jgi:hypothetical protein